MRKLAKTTLAASLCAAVLIFGALPAENAHALSFGGSDETAQLPDFVKLVESYGHVGLRATTYEELDRCIEEAFGKYKDDLVFVDVHIEREEPVRPMVGPGQGLTEMVLSEEK